MSNKEQKHFTQPLQFDKAVLAARKEKAKDRILNGYYNERDWVYPAVNHLVFNSYEQVLQAVVEQTKAGNELFTGHVLRMPIPGYSEAYFYKPKAEIDALLKIEYERVEQAYKEEVEADVKAKTELLANQLYEQTQAKAKKAAEDKDRKEREAAMKEAQDYLASLMKEAK